MSAPKTPAGGINAPGLIATGGLLATVVHDLRNPLSTVRTNLDFVVREPGAPDATEALEDAQSAVNELVRALDLVVHLSRALMGEPAYDASPGDVLEVLRADERLAGTEIEAKGEGPFASTYGAIASVLVVPLVEISKSASGARTTRIEIERQETRIAVSVLDDGAPLPDELARVALTPLGPRMLRASPRRGRYGGLYAVSAIAASIDVSLTLGRERGLSAAKLLFPV